MQELLVCTNFIATTFLKVVEASVLKEKPAVCLVACSVLKEEIRKLQEQGSLNAQAVYVSKFFHIDYAAVEKNVRKVLEQTKKRFNGKIVLVYGDLCMGQDNEMKKLAAEYSVTKVDAVNCIDCQLGGNGKFFEADPDHKLMFMGPGMIDFFKHAKEQLQKEGLDEAAFADMFSGIKGVVLLDTCGNTEKCVQDIKESGMNLQILETRKVGLEGVKRVILDAIDHANGIN
jgi:hypothetical protein